MAAPKVGESAVCRHCDTPIVYKPRVDGRYSFWVHHKSGNQNCPGNEGSYNRAHRASPNDRCTEQMSSGDYWHSGDRTCYKKIKDTELMMCGIHARVVRQEEKRRQDAEEERNKNDIISGGVRDAIKVLESYGVEGAKMHIFRDPRNPFEGRITGLVTLDPFKLADLLEEYAAEQEEEF